MRLWPAGIGITNRIGIDFDAEQIARANSHRDIQLTGYEDLDIMPVNSDTAPVAVAEL